MLDQVIQKIKSVQENQPLFQGIKRGIERETLRVNAYAKLAASKHSSKLGSKLTHPHITTDYSENLLELISSPHENIDDLLSQLHDIHAYTASCLPEEYFWPMSMPCRLGSEQEIPIADYGKSNSGQMKMHYRRGLGHRYGRHMQTIAGLHLNFSLPQSFWEFYYTEVSPEHDTLRDCIDNNYMALIRNYLRHSWLIYYLFGASPAVHKSFFSHKAPNYLLLQNKEFYTCDQAVALRMSNIGYQSLVQDTMKISYNSLYEYTETLKRATETPLAAYQRITEQFGAAAQLNSNILQIEAEFYGPIRPKQTFCAGRRPVFTLRSKGIEYLEVRALDIDPFEPLGINRQRVQFMDVFLIYCLLLDKSFLSAADLTTIHQNQIATVTTGGNADCLLRDHKGQQWVLKDWAKAIFADLETVASLLDAEAGDTSYSEALKTYKLLLDEPNRTLAQKYLAAMQSEGFYLDYGRKLMRQHKDFFAQHPLSKDKHLEFVALAKQSLGEQKAMEQDDAISYEEYVKQYYEACDC
jgi:glutamate--cysteine ligase